ncbi:hypothetical protein EYR40_000429 [Pleurotus pulmonarius]|nr:hypothetical protein EYR40_000429 [Pleurotus pulmonarius]
MPLQHVFHYAQTLCNRYTLYTQTYVSGAIPELAEFRSFLFNYTITEKLCLSYGINAVNTEYMEEEDEYDEEEEEDSSDDDTVVLVQDEDDDEEVQRITLYYSDDVSVCYAVDTGGNGLAIPLLSQEFTLGGTVFNHRPIRTWPYDCGSSESSTRVEDALWLLGIEAELPTMENIQLRIQHLIINGAIGEVYTLSRYPHTINHIRTAFIIAPQLHRGDLIMNGCLRAPLTLEDLVFHCDFGFGKIQGILRGKVISYKSCLHSDGAPSNQLRMHPLSLFGSGITLFVLITMDSAQLFSTVLISQTSHLLTFQNNGTKIDNI